MIKYISATILIIWMTLQTDNAYSQSHPNGENNAYKFLEKILFNELNEWSQVSLGNVTEMDDTQKTSHKYRTQAKRLFIMENIINYNNTSVKLNDELCDYGKKTWWGFFKDMADWELPFKCEFVSADLKERDKNGYWFYVAFNVNYIDHKNYRTKNHFCGMLTNDFVRKTISTHEYMYITCSTQECKLEKVAEILPSQHDYLTFSAIEPNSLVGIKNYNNNPNIEYSINEGNSWQQLTEQTPVRLANIGDKMLIRGNNPQGFSTESNKYTKFVMSGKIDASGNTMSLVDGTGESISIPSAYCFYKLFNNCISLTTAPKLPAINLRRYCYEQMFDSCTSLIRAPTLPAYKLTSNCYSFMFRDCYRLTSAPELPATILKFGCYKYMFARCTGLTSAPELPATFLATSCYSNMFKDCNNLTSAPELPATNLADYCYSSMFEGCSSLSSAPKLPATTLTNGCYYGMFKECYSLENTPQLPATILADKCYYEMFWSCKSIKTAPELPADCLKHYCYRDMFGCCTSLTSAPKHLGTQMDNYCCLNMFSACTSLISAPELPATKLAEGCYFGMFEGCTSLTSAPELPATNLAVECYKWMFKGCTNLKSIKVKLSDWEYDPQKKYDSGNYNPTGEWLEEIAPNGTFYCPRALSKEFDNSHIPQGWTVEYID